MTAENIVERKILPDGNTEIKEELGCITHTTIFRPNGVLVSDTMSNHGESNNDKLISKEECGEKSFDLGPVGIGILEARRRSLRHFRRH